jgi:uncharacterized protein
MHGETRQVAAADRSGPASNQAWELEAELKVFHSAFGQHVFVADGSRVYDLTAEEAATLQTSLARGQQRALEKAYPLLDDLGLFRPADRRRITLDVIEPPHITAISLNVAQACNMGCRYCYADEGRFGGRARVMAAEIARASVDCLFAQSGPDARLVLGFMGGEPLLSRAVVHDTAYYAFNKAKQCNRDIGFSITTNATLLTEEDARLFHELPFSVTFSIDGTRDLHRLQRPMHNGGDSYEAVLQALRLVQRVGRPKQLAARTTVTARTGRLLPLLDHIVGLGFDDVGFSALLVSPDPSLSFTAADFGRHLEHMIECGEKAIAEIEAGRPYPFGNLETALHEIHRGAHRPLPCGAGAGYLSVNAEGRLYACHRLIDDPAFAMGDVYAGTDVPARRLHLNRSHVDLMEPCRRCWARYLCGGGCHHEVKARGRLGCDYIRGWLEFCLTAYVELSTYFSRTGGHPWCHQVPGRQNYDPFSGTQGF